MRSPGWLLDRNNSHGSFLDGLFIARASFKPDDALQFGSAAVVKVRFLLNTVEDARCRRSLSWPNGNLSLLGSVILSFQLLDSEAPLIT